MAPADLPQFPKREPLCMGSAGNSTRKAWPDGLVPRITSHQPLPPTSFKLHAASIRIASPTLLLAVASET
jgi:hypothetical protein